MLAPRTAAPELGKPRIFIKCSNRNESDLKVLDGMVVVEGPIISGGVAAIRVIHAGGRFLIFVVGDVHTNTIIVIITLLCWGLPSALVLTCHAFN